jgi:hypothetical protein
MDLQDRFFGHDAYPQGYCVDSGTSIINLNDFAVNQSLPAFFGANGFTLDITSSDNTKDVAAGTGAQKIKIYGLDVNLRQLTEVVTMNGQTAVTTVNAFRRVFGASVLVVGTDSLQAGDIYIVKHGSSTWAAGVPNTLTAASVVCKILIANGAGYTGYYTVPVSPSGALPRKYRAGSVTPTGSVQNANFLIQAQKLLVALDNAISLVFQTMIAGLTAGGPGFVDLEHFNLDFEEGTDIVMKIVPLVTAGQITAILHLREV